LWLLGSFPSGKGDLSRLWLSCLGPWVFLLPKFANFKNISTFMGVIPHINLSHFQFFCWSYLSLNRVFSVELKHLYKKQCQIWSSNYNLLGINKIIYIGLETNVCTFCRSLFVIFSFFFWILYGMSFIDLRILITPLVAPFVLI
jgi:hypothetical protein